MNQLLPKKINLINVAVKRKTVSLENVMAPSMTTFKLSLIGTEDHQPIFERILEKKQSRSVWRKWDVFVTNN
jgi:hypothetical protein